METSDDMSTLSFVEQSKYCFEKSYPNWRDVVSASSDQKTETISIPDSLDILPNRRLENHHSLETSCMDGSSASAKNTDDLKKAKQALKRDLSGQAGEDGFFRAFRQLKVGGILILGFDTQEFVKKMNKENVSDFNYSEWKQSKKHFECDAIFIHHLLGVFIIEVKGCDSGKVQKRFSEAASQLDRRIFGMQNIYQQITGKDCPLDFHGVICIPNVIVNFRHERYTVIGKTEIEGDDFEKFWHVPSNRQQHSEVITDDYFSFIATIAGYRSAKFVNLSTNALEIYRIIEQQEFKRKNKQQSASTTYHCNLQQLPKQSMNAKTLILNQEQLNAVECKEQHVVLSGPPGTGKTIVLLLRALAASKLNKPGRVIIIPQFFGMALDARFKKFVELNISDMKRTVIVECSGSYLCRDLPQNLEDDIFCDEVSSDVNYLNMFMQRQGKNWEHMSNIFISGTTTIALTGELIPQHVAESDMNETVINKLFPDFHHIELKTVIRGTHSIIDEWKRFFPDRFLTVGHNVKGAPVERIILNNFSDLQSIIEGKVVSLLNDSDKYFGFTMYPQNLAILVSSTLKYAPKEYYVIILHIKKNLKSKGIYCGNINQQVNDRNLVAVDNALNTISYDWPIVVFITGNDDADDLVAMSRCISKLIIIKI